MNLLFLFQKFRFQKICCRNLYPDTSGILFRKMIFPMVVIILSGLSGLKHFLLLQPGIERLEHLCIVLMMFVQAETDFAVDFSDGQTTGVFQRKGEIYEMNFFAPKEQAFKSRVFLQEVKEVFTNLIYEIVADEAHKQTVFDPDGPYLPTKKIGKNNPLAEEIRADNAARQEWNRAVDEAVVSGVPEPEIVEVKRENIAAPVRSSIQKHGHLPARLRDILTKAVGVLRAKIKALRIPAKTPPVIVIDLDAFKQMQRVKNVLDDIMNRMRETDQKIAAVEKELSGLSGLAGLLHSKQRSELAGSRDELLEYRTSQATLLNSTVKKEGYKSVAAFMAKYNRMYADIASHQDAVRRSERSYVQLKKRASVNVTLQEKGRQNEQKRQMRRGDRSTERV